MIYNIYIWYIYICIYIMYTPILYIYIHQVHQYMFVTFKSRRNHSKFVGIPIFDRQFYVYIRANPLEAPAPKNHMKLYMPWANVEMMVVEYGGIWWNMVEKIQIFPNIFFGGFLLLHRESSGKRTPASSQSSHVKRARGACQSTGFGGSTARWGGANGREGIWRNSLNWSAFTC